jgi:hypothetical protein
MRGVRYTDPRHCNCGGGIVYNGPAADGRPEFRCTKCERVFTCGRDGGRWAVLIPSSDAHWNERNARP